MKSFRTELNLNDKQRTACEKHAGTGRLAYNWALSMVDLLSDYKIYPTAIDLHKLWVATYKKDNHWVCEVSKFTPQQAFRDLESGLKRFWKYKNETKGKKLPLEKVFKKRILQKMGKKYILKSEWIGRYIPLTMHFMFPNFKKKNASDGFYLESPQVIRVHGNKIKLPKIGSVKSFEKLPVLAAKSVAITKYCGKWFIAYRIERTKANYKKEHEKVGVDLGIKTLAKLSTGKDYPTQRRYIESRKKLARLQRKSSRQYEAFKARTKDEKLSVDQKRLISNNFQKTKLQIQKVHYKIGCIRKHSLHQLTSDLAKNHSRIVIEDLNVSGMMKNHNLAGAIANGSFSEFRRQLTYKCEWYGSELVVADRFFASSKTCSCCGHKQEMPLKKREFDCEKCDNKMDRDLNAAINLANYKPKTADSSAVAVCGDSKFHDASQVGIGEAEIKHQMSKFWVSFEEQRRLTVRSMLKTHLPLRSKVDLITN